MQNLYSDQTFLAVDRQLKRRLVLLSAVLAVLLGVFVWAMVARIEWLAAVSACVAGCFAVFYADLFCAWCVPPCPAGITNGTWNSSGWNRTVPWWMALPAAA